MFVNQLEELNTVAEFLIKPVLLSEENLKVVIEVQGAGLISSTQVPVKRPRHLMLDLMP